jgi:hypothetical protein
MLSGEHLETIIDKHLETDKMEKLKKILKKFEEK